MNRLTTILLCGFFVILAACSGVSKETVMVEDPWVRAAVMMDEGSNLSGMNHMSGSTSAAYMLIRNNGEEPDRLLAVASDAAHAVEIHESREVNGVVSMEPIQAVEIPSRGSAELKPGGMHVMLIGLTRDLKAGETVNLDLTFENAGKITVAAEVRAP